MITQQPSPGISFDWTQDALARIVAGIDWALHQQAVLFILAVVAFIWIIQYAIGGSES